MPLPLTLITDYGQMFHPLYNFNPLLRLEQGGEVDELSITFCVLPSIEL